MTKQRKCRLKIARRRRKSEDHTCHDTSSLKKKKNINYYYNYTTILSGERYLAKNAKKQVRFLHTKHSTNYLCLKKLKKKISQDEHEDRRITRVPQKKKYVFRPPPPLIPPFFEKLKKIYNSSYVAISISYSLF